MPPPSRQLSFAGFTLDLTRLSLTHPSGREIALRPKSFDVLRYLVQNAGRVIGKDEVIKSVWVGAPVTDDSLVQCVKEIREAIGDLEHSIVKTIPRRGYLFTPLVEEEALPAPRGAPASPVRYARSGEVHVAFQSWGEGEVDLVFFPGFITHIENLWSEPRLARFLMRLGEFARVITFDKRGTGMSDRVNRLPAMDERVDDVRAVLDCVGIERAVIMGPSEGGSLAAYFAATHPQRCQALVLYGAFAQFTSWIPSEPALQELFGYVKSAWGSGGSLASFAPSMVGDDEFQKWWGRFERLGASPGDAVALLRVNSQIDITEILPAIQVPTLVIHRTGDVTVDVEGGRLLAARIPNARLVELPGTDHLFWTGDNSDEILRLVEEFVVGHQLAPALDPVLATVLAMNGIPAVAGHERVVRQELARFLGRPAQHATGPLVATFDAPSRAIRSALAIRDALARLGPQVQIGIHIGEVERNVDGVRGLAVSIAEALMRRAQPAEILVSRTVRDLVAGSGIKLEYVDSHTLRGAADPSAFYRVKDLFLVE